MSKSQYTHDVVATVGEYTNGQGETKKEYVKCGTAFTDDQGRISLKMSTIPVTPNWSGWLSLYPKKEQQQNNGQAPQQRPQQSQAPSQQQRAPQPQDDIPF